MIKITWCSTCKNFTGMKDGWKPTCKAFPDGIPYDFDTGLDKEIKICNNGIGYEEEKAEEMKEL